MNTFDNSIKNSILLCEMAQKAKPFPYGGLNFWTYGIAAARTELLRDYPADKAVPKIVIGLGVESVIDAVTDDGFRSSFDPVARLTEVAAGHLGTMYGMTVLGEAQSAQALTTKSVILAALDQDQNLIASVSLEHV